MKKFGIKGFDKNLMCRSTLFEIGGTYEISATPKLCSVGFHYCKNIKDVFDHYPNGGTNRYCFVEILGDVAEGVYKCATNKIKIIRELTPEELTRQINGMKSTTLLELCNKGYAIGGSLALKIQGYDLGRIITDIDLISTKSKNDTISLAKNNFPDFGEINVFSGADTVVAYRGYFGEKYDIMSAPNTTIVKRVYEGVELNVIDAKVIWEHKLVYALQGNKKHMTDIKHCGILFSMINDKVKIYSDNELPF